MNSKKTYGKNDYRTDYDPVWCKGCSFFGILSALTNVLEEKQLNPSKVNIISGIGCSSRIVFNFNTFGMHTLHGRAIPVAVGARLARPDIAVIVIGGDGDLFSIGTGHFVHAARNNFNMTVICIDNRMYAMTKNQTSPTSGIGCVGSLSPYGNMSNPLNIIDFAITCGATFIARTFFGSLPHMQTIIKQAFDHNGFSFIEIIAPCNTFDKSFNRTELCKRIVDINDNGTHDITDHSAAVKLASKTFSYDSNDSSEIPIGLFRKISKLTFDEQVQSVKKKRGLVI
jgi:2-oxoglutarate ferredoxin oxidoreductase subunit beta